MAVAKLFASKAPVERDRGFLLQYGIRMASPLDRLVFIGQTGPRKLQ